MALGGFGLRVQSSAEGPSPQTLSLPPRTLNPKPGVNMMPGSPDHVVLMVAAGNRSCRSKKGVQTKTYALKLWPEYQQPAISGFSSSAGVEAAVVVVAVVVATKQLKKYWSE